VRAFSLEKTSRCAIAYWTAMSPVGVTPLSFRSAHRSATRRAQKKICFFTKLPASAFSSTAAYIFSYSRGTERTRVGRTSGRLSRTFSMDSAYAIDVPVSSIM
jgi:hypothetical protein